MVTLLPKVESFGSSFGRALGSGIGKGALAGFEKAELKKQQAEALKGENEALAKQGINLSGIKDPKLRQQMQASALQGKNQRELEKLKQNRSLTSLQKTQQDLANARKDKLDRETQFYNDLEKQQAQTQNETSNQPLEDFEEPQPRKSIKKKPPHTKAEIDKATAVNAQLGNNYQRQNEEFQRQQEHEQRINTDKAKIERDEKKFFHKETAKFDSELEEAAKTGEKKNRALERQMADVDKLGWWDRAVSAIAGQTPYGDLLRSKTAQEFDANTLPQMEGQRQILGGILSDSDIRLLMQKIVTASKDPEANKTIAKNMMFENNLPVYKSRIGQEIKAANGGFRPPNYLQEIDKIYNERYGDQIRKMFDETMSLPDDKKKLADIGRRKVPPGTILSEQAIDMYLELANNDPELASKMAEEDNYVVPR